jgi:16S rRNA (cytosine967-C5)-methyltransferase
MRMSPSPARRAAFTVLRQVESAKGFAVDLMQDQEFLELTEADRALGTELVMGVLRRREELDRDIERLSGRSVATLDREVVIALSLGLYQMRFLDRIPASAAVNESVELVKHARKRSAAGLVNAVLRKFAASREPAPPGVVNVPEWLFARWINNFGDDAARRIAAASASRPPTCLRVCGATASLEAVQRELDEDGVQTRRALLAHRALVVESGNAKKSRAWQEGRVVIQDEGSQLVIELLNPRPESKLLDVCAAPGMKLTQLAELLGRGSILACDSSESRLMTMEALAKAHIGPAIHFTARRLDVTREQPPGGPFDFALVDAPCTGTGTLAHNPEIKLRLKPADIERLHCIQTRILINSLAVLVRGGRLVYSTCSLEPEENEQVVAEVLAASPFRLLTAPELAAQFPYLAPFFEAPGCFRTRPNLSSESRLDGFFAAVIVRAA